MNREELKAKLNQEELNSKLIKAATDGDADRVKTLLPTPSSDSFTHLADVHVGNDLPLRLAATKGHTKTVQVLLQAGADVNVCNDQVLCYIASKGDAETVQVLLQALSTRDFTRWNNLHAQEELAFICGAAAYDGHTATVRVLLQARSTCGFTHPSTCGFTHPSTCGFTQCNNIHDLYDDALCFAAENGHAETVQVLLQAGVNSNSARFTFQELKKFLTPQFILSLSDSVMTAMETSHPELKDQYKYSENKFLLKKNDKEISFNAKISLADLYYRPGGPGYYQAISSL